MLCQICQLEKLSKEFPPETVTELCEHPILVCLRCTVEHVKASGMCPEEGCECPANSHKVSLFEAILTEMFREYEVTQTPEAAAGDPRLPELTVTMLTGDSIKVLHSSHLSIFQLKKEIYQQMGHEIDSQKLLWRDQELEVYRADGEFAKLSDYSVPQNSTIYLVVILYSIPATFNNVVFDLFWGYPMYGRDYLDASCLIFRDQHLMSICDYKYRRYGSCVFHSGDVMSDEYRQGHHTIQIVLKELPSTVTHLVFVLSAWNSPNISRYPNPSLKFFEVTSPNKDLCKTTFTHAGRAQAVIMCSVSRGKDGLWHVYESGKLSAGNAKNYNPLQNTIQNLIAQGF